MTGVAYVVQLHCYSLATFWIGILPIRFPALCRWGDRWQYDFRGRVSVIDTTVG